MKLPKIFNNTIINFYVNFVSAGCRLRGSVFVSRLARRIATEPRGRGPRRTGPDHQWGHAALATARRRPAVAASRVRDHAASWARHQAHVGTTGPDARLHGAPAQNDGSVHGSRAGRVGRGPDDHLQSSAVPRTWPVSARPGHQGGHGQ